MPIEMHQSVAEVHPYDAENSVGAALVETIWHDLDHQLSRERVRCVVAEVTLGFQDATVKTFLPILVHRRALEQLRQELGEMDSTDGQ